MAFEALKGCLGGHVTVAHHKLRAKKKQYFADVTQEKVERQ